MSQRFSPSDSAAGPQAGLIKGMRVCTQQGPKAIDQLQLGELVWSAQGDALDSPAYRRVLALERHADQAVTHLSIETAEVGCWDFVAAADSQLFCVQGMGWTRADALRAGQHLRTADGLRAVASTRPVYRTSRAGVGWVTNGRRIRDMHGRVFDYANHAIVGLRTST